MRLAILTGLYVAVVCSAQIGAQKIVVLPFTARRLVTESPREPTPVPGAAS